MISHDKRYPNESEAYRAARNRLLEAEADLRARVEAVADLRRRLPPGGAIPRDYTFQRLDGTGAAEPVRLSALFAHGRDTLVIYSYMFKPDTTRAGYPFPPGPCPMCTSFIDGLDAQAPHIRERVELAVVAKAPIDALADYGSSRGWRHVPLLSSLGTTFDADYLSESVDGAPMPMLNVFVRDRDGVRHSWGSELLYATPGGSPRHVDQLWPLWNVFDLTPAGRGTDWYPKLTYTG